MQRFFPPKWTVVSGIVTFIAMQGMMLHAEDAISGMELRQARHRMVDSQIRARGVVDERVLAALKEIPRHEFVPEDLKREAYDDNALPIGYEQTISQPYIVGYMTELLGLGSTDRVLEIGTGSGYQAAVLAEIAAEVYTVEILEPLYARAKGVLKELGYENINFKHGDGWKGWADHAPYDKIIVTAAPDKIPAALVEQLREGGKLVIPVGTFNQKIIVGEKQGGVLKKTEKLLVRFVPLVRDGHKGSKAV